MFAKKGVHIYMWVGNLLFFLSTWHFDIFLGNLSLTFLPILQNPSYLGMFWKFPCPSQVGYQNISTIKWTTSKETAEDGSVPLVVSGIPGIKSFFFNLLNWYETLCSVTGVSSRG